MPWILGGISRINSGNLNLLALWHLYRPTIHLLQLLVGEIKSILQEALIIHRILFPDTTQVSKSENV